MMTIAQQCRESVDPFGMASRLYVYTGRPELFIKRFHFVDGSFLDFKIMYEVVSDD